jgi:uncharacterized protein
MPNAPTPEPRRSACVVCGQPVAPATAPFCSKGCKDRDLLEWFTEGHRIPGQAIDDQSVDGLDSDEDRT